MKLKPIKWIQRMYSYEGMVCGVTMFSYNWRTRSQSDPPTEKPWELHSKLPGTGKYYCADQDACQLLAQRLIERFLALVIEEEA